jgi:DNA invertase Pin-like site-specific DNA recombinase
MTLQFMAVIAEFEAKRISERVHAALEVLKSRGVRLGPKTKKLTAQDSLPHRLQLNEKKKQNAFQYAEMVYPTIKFYKNMGLNNSLIAQKMNERGDRTPSGQGRWQAVTVGRCLNRYENSRIIT